MSTTVLGTAFFAVLLAEMVGDKLLYGTSALAARFGAMTVLAGVLPALAAKSLIAVAMGGVIARLPPPIVAASSFIAFGLAAYSIWRGPGPAAENASGDANTTVRRFQLRGALAAFAAVFFTEWADPGQLATAALAVRTHEPLLVWLGASAAMTTKAIIALSLGTVVRRVAPQRFVRLAGASLVVILAISAALGLD